MQIEVEQYLNFEILLRLLNCSLLSFLAQIDWAVQVLLHC